MPPSAAVKACGNVARKARACLDRLSPVREHMHKTLAKGRRLIHATGCQRIGSFSSSQLEQSRETCIVSIMKITL